jgi:hypothetical protein
LSISRVDKEMAAIDDESVRRTKHWFIGYLVLSVILFLILFLVDASKEENLTDELEQKDKIIKELSEANERYKVLITTIEYSNLDELKQVESKMKGLLNDESLSQPQIDYLNGQLQFVKKVQDSISGIYNSLNEDEANLLAIKEMNANLLKRIDSIQHNDKQQRSQLQRRLRNLESELAAKKKALARKETISVITFQSSKGKKVHYLGEVEEGKANGGGVGIWPTGGLYRGDWVDNERHGEGRYVWSNEHVYEGEFQNDVREGEGTYYWPSGERYEGEWSDDKRSGQGILYDKDGNIQYSGKWIKDEIVK